MATYDIGTQEQRNFDSALSVMMAFMEQRLDTLHKMQSTETGEKSTRDTAKDTLLEFHESQIRQSIVQQIIIVVDNIQIDKDGQPNEDQVNKVLEAFKKYPQPDERALINEAKESVGESMSIRSTPAERPNSAQEVLAQLAESDTRTEQNIDLKETKEDRVAPTEAMETVRETEPVTNPEEKESQTRQEREQKDRELAVEELKKHGDELKKQGKVEIPPSEVNIELGEEDTTVDKGATAVGKETAPAEEPPKPKKVTLHLGNPGQQRPDRVNIFAEYTKHIQTQMDQYMLAAAESAANRSLNVLDRGMSPDIAIPMANGKLLWGNYIEVGGRTYTAIPVNVYDRDGHLVLDQDGNPTHKTVYQCDILPQYTGRPIGAQIPLANREAVLQQMQEDLKQQAISQGIVPGTSREDGPNLRPMDEVLYFDAGFISTVAVNGVNPVYCWNGFDGKTGILTPEETQAMIMGESVTITALTPSERDSVLLGLNIPRTENNTLQLPKQLIPKGLVVDRTDLMDRLNYYMERFIETGSPRGKFDINFGENTLPINLNAYVIRTAQQRFGFDPSVYAKFGYDEEQIAALAAGAHKGLQPQFIEQIAQFLEGQAPKGNSPQRIWECMQGYSMIDDMGLTNGLSKSQINFLLTGLTPAEMTPEEQGKHQRINFSADKMRELRYAMVRANIVSNRLYLGNTEGIEARNTQIMELLRPLSAEQIHVLQDTILSQPLHMIRVIAKPEYTPEQMQKLVELSNMKSKGGIDILDYQQVGDYVERQFYVKNMLEQHKLYIDTHGAQGELADFRRDPLFGKLEGIDFGPDGGLYEFKDYLPGITFKNVSLQGARFENLSLMNANLAGADLAGATFKNVDLSMARLDQADIYNTHFENTKLQNANLEGVRGDGVEFRNCNMTALNMTGCQCNDMLARNCTIENSHFYRAQMARVHFENCKINVSGFTDTCLYGAHFSGTAVSDCSFGSFYDDKPAAMYDMKIEPYNMQISSFTKCRFVRADMSGSDISHTAINQCKFGDTNMRGTHIDSCRISRCDFAPRQEGPSDLSTVVIKNSTLCEDTNFKGADLKYASIGKSNTKDETVRGLRHERRLNREEKRESKAEAYRQKQALKEAKQEAKREAKAARHSGDER